MRRLSVAVVGFVVAACTSEVEGGGGSNPSTKSAPLGCADIAGNYSVDVKRVDGTCPVEGDGTSTTSVTIARIDSKWNVALPGIAGGCQGDLDAASCKLAALCEIVDTKTGAVLISYNLVYTFDGDAFSGSLAGQIEPPVYPTSCTATAKHEGTRL